jgi:hypothetical protein
MKNKRGDIPIVILVIGVFVVCTLALLSFFNSSIQVKNSFVGIDLIEEMNSQVEKSQFFKEDVSEFYLEKKKLSSFGEIFFPWTKEKIVFSVKYNLPS